VCVCVCVCVCRREGEGEVCGFLSVEGVLRLLSVEGGC
jgi:hypothetical protein